MRVAFRFYVIQKTNSTSRISPLLILNKHKYSMEAPLMTYPERYSLGIVFIPQFMFRYSKVYWLIIFI